MGSPVSRPLVVLLLGLVAASAAAQGLAPLDPALAELNEPVALTAFDTTVGQASAFVSGQCSYTVVADPRYRDLRVSLAGVEGTLGEVVSALCLASGLEARRLERWIVLSPTRRGIAVAAREMRAQHAPRLIQEQAELGARRDAAAAQAMMRLGLATPAQALGDLDEFQLAALDAQGYLTVAQLFPEYYLPLYDVFGFVIDGRAQRPLSLPEFAGTRLYLDPALRLELYLPGGGEAESNVWPIDVIPAGAR